MEPDYGIHRVHEMTNTGQHATKSVDDAQNAA